MVTVDGAALQVKLQGFSIGHVGFEMSVRYSSRAVWATGSINLDFWRESWTREKFWSYQIFWAELYPLPAAQFVC